MHIINQIFFQPIFVSIPLPWKYFVSYIKCILYIKYSSSRSSSRSHYPVYRARPALPTSVCSAQLLDQLKRYWYRNNIYGGGAYIDVITCDTYLRTQHEFDASNIIFSFSPGIEFNNDMQLLGTYLLLRPQATWQDVTGSTPLELCKDVVHFSTKVTNRKKKKSGVRQQNNI